MRKRNIHYRHSVAVQDMRNGNSRYRYTRRFLASGDSAARANIGAYRQRLNQRGRVTITEFLCEERIRIGKLVPIRTINIGVDERQRNDQIG